VKTTLRLAVYGWLTIQLTGLVAAPMALCSHGASAGADRTAACCPGVGPGQICPMHKAREGAPKCRMETSCHESDAALLSLLTAAGLLPAAIAVFDISPPLDLVVVAAGAPVARADLPDPPPPRL
jgi:hypothetical protein